MNRAVIYARYSDDKQQEQSIDGQLRVCKKFAIDNDLDIVNTYIDRAISGRSDDRAQFLKMIKDSYKDRFDYVIVYKLDRFSRNKYDSAVYNHTLKKNKVRRLSATENISDGPEGVLMESVLEGIAEYYSLELAQKVKRGIRESLLQGNTIGGKRTYGFRVKDKKYYIDESEAEVVRIIFNMYDQGKTQEEISFELKLHGYDFRKDKIYYILKNQRYLGIYKHGEDTYYNIFPQIIKSHVFNSVQEKLHKNKKAPAAKKAKVPYYLTSKLYCSNCGRLMIPDSGRGRNKTLYKYYNCNKKERHVCHIKPVGKDYIENLVGYLLIEKILTEDMIMTLINDAVRLYNKEIKDTSRVKSLEKNKTKIKTSISNLVQVAKKGLATSIILEELDKLEKELSVVENKLSEELKNKTPEMDRDTVLFLFDFYVRNEDHKDFTEFLLDTFVSKVIYNEDDGVISIIINMSEDNVFDLKIENLNGSILNGQGVPFIK